MTRRLLLVAGTRPEVIKLAPIARECKVRDIPYQFLLTGQQGDIASELLPWFELDSTVFLKHEPYLSLSHSMSNLLIRITNVVMEVRPSLLIAQGDTTTTIASAFAAFYNHLPFIHLEAGLRCQNPYIPFPEEMNRRLISKLTSEHMAPTQIAANNLIAEGFDAENVHLVGNSVIDALNFTLNKLDLEKREKWSFINEEFVLVTAHRRESFGKPIVEICRSIQRLANDLEVTFVWPVHPNPEIRNVVHHLLSNCRNVILLEPLPYWDFVNLMRKAVLILTDSGGIQEEAPTLKKPVVLLRDQTERIELQQSGGSVLVGQNPDSIYSTTRQLLEDPTFYSSFLNTNSLFGDGNTAHTVVDILMRKF